MTQRPVVIGTAGHIDHGKTWLVRALTGKDTDRLPEEKERGISIDLGYAPLELPGGRLASVIDVPGHERFVRNMVAGATGIDLVLLVIDAAEGTRTQTVEHLAIVRLLGISEGVVAVTKADAVDAETLELALEEARELVPGAPVVPVSAKAGTGLDELRRALARVAERLGDPTSGWPTRLFVDRAFTLTGIGTVATGTLRSGSIGQGDELRAEPAGLDVRVRSVQVHDRAVERAQAGQRVAVSVPGVERSALRRGDALVEPGSYPVSYRLDVVLEELAPIPDGARLRVHHGTADIVARLVRFGNGYAQLRLAEPVVAARGDRVVLRDRTTLGGARVIDPSPPRRAHPERLALLDATDPTAVVRATIREPVTRRALLARALLPPDQLDAGLAAVSQAGDWYFAGEWLDALRGAVTKRLQAHAASSPLDPGLPSAELVPASAWSGAIAPLLGLDQREGRLYLPGSAPSLRGREAAARALETELERAGLDPVKVPDAALAAFLESDGRIVRLGDGFAVGRPAFERARTVLVEECERAGAIRLARFRDLLATSRSSAQLLLERFDADGVTRRIGDERVLRRR